MDRHSGKLFFKDARHLYNILVKFTAEGLVISCGTRGISNFFGQSDSCGR